MNNCNRAARCGVGNGKVLMPFRTKSDFSFLQSEVRLLGTAEPQNKEKKTKKKTSLVVDKLASKAVLTMQACGSCARLPPAEFGAQN